MFLVNMAGTLRGLSLLKMFRKLNTMPAFQTKHGGSLRSPT